MFVILVCSVSYFGYFLGRIADRRAGTKLAAVLGGITSSTAANARHLRDQASRQRMKRRMKLAPPPLQTRSSSHGEALAT
jgi:uncharacterized membrane protein (DUF4010 family)